MKRVQPKPRLFGVKKTIGIIASQYNKNYVDALIQAVEKKFRELEAQTEIIIYRVPGAYEIPVCAEYVIKKIKPNALIALGVIIQGETSHADLISQSVFSALQKIAIKNKTPIINEILCVENTQQAEFRTTDRGKNRGSEAALAAHDMIELFSAIHIKNKKKNE